MNCKKQEQIIQFSLGQSGYWCHGYFPIGYNGYYPSFAICEDFDYWFLGQVGITLVRLAQHSLSMIMYQKKIGLIDIYNPGRICFV